MIGPNKLSLGLLAAFGVLASASMPAMAQGDAANLQRVEITGSALKRVASETALPVQIITRKEIEQSGASSTTELLQRLPSMQNATMEGSAVGGETYGFSGVSIHNIGETRTLVLLNGHRIAKSGGQAVTGALNGVDLNTLPLSAIDRIEILTDGASALYGADAVAGVVNIITRKTSTEVIITAGKSNTTGGGAGEERFSLSKGFGDYSTDGFNVSFALSMDKRKPLAATQRSFAKTGLISFTDENGRLLKVSNSNATSKRSIPANLNLYFNDPAPAADGGGIGQLDRLNPVNVATGTCPAFHVISGSSCRYDFTSQLEIYPDRQRSNAFVSFDKDLGQGIKWYGEALLSRTKSTARIAPPPGELAIPAGTPAFATALALAAAAGYAPGPYVGGLYVPLPGDTAADIVAGNQALQTNFDPSLLDANLRFTELGKRTNVNTQSLLHFVTGLEGTIKDWDYNTSFVHSRNTAKDTFGGGYASVSGVAGAVLKGFDPFLPFGAQSAAGKAAIDGAKIDGYWNGGVTTLDMLRVQASREVGKLDGGAVQLALGSTYQREQLDARSGDILGGRKTYPTDVDGNPCAATGLPCVGTGIDQRFGDTGIQPSYSASRKTFGVFAELGMPVTKQLELTGSARFDHSSDFGNTVNGKAAARFQPTKELLFRGSVGTGYIAPSLAQVRAPKQNFGVTRDSYDCAGSPAAVALQTLANNLGVICDGGTQFNLYAQGNLALQPERSKQATLGMVWDLTPSSSFSADLWNVRISNLIGQIDEKVASADPAKFAKNFTDFTDPSTGKKLLAFILPNDNLGNASYTGIDLAANTRFDVGGGKWTSNLAATLLLRSVAQQEKGGKYLSDIANKDDNGNVSFRWQGKWTNSFATGSWAHALTLNFKSGYKDSPTDPAPTIVATGLTADGFRVKVPSFVTYDWQTTFALNKTIVLTGGIINLTNKNPPFVFSQGGLNRGQEVGWDGRYYDPRGRTLYLNGTVKF